MSRQNALQAAVAHHQAGRFTEAEDVYRRILTDTPNHFDALHLLGVLLSQTGRADAAVELIRRAIRMNPGIAEAHSNLGNALREKGLLDEAIASYQKAIQLRPELADAHNNLGGALREKGLLTESIAACRHAIHLKSDYPDAHNNLGVALRQCGQVLEAIDCYRRAIQLRPNYVEAHVNLGNALKELGQFDEAIIAYRRALEFRPGHAEAHLGLGSALKESGRIDEAMASYQRAIQFQPRYAEAHVNMAAALELTGQLDQALAICQRAIEFKPDMAEAHHNRGVILGSQGRGAEAIDAYREAIRLKPDYADAHFALALMLLLMGELRQAWPEHEWRCRVKSLSMGRSFVQPQWTGTDLTGQTILLHAEQGLGDTMQFVRYAPLVARRGGRVLLECQPALAGLLRQVPGVQQVIPKGQPLPPFDLHCPLLSLPLAFGTELQSIPAHVPYINAEPERIAAWTPRLRACPPGFKVGLVWAGNPHHKRDRQRSITLAQFAPLSRVPGVVFYSLQKGERSGQAAPQGMNWINLTGDLNDFIDTAALVHHLDLIITVDTSVAHLAGAMGKPVWLLLPFVPDWRWLLEREDSLWYPTMRLYRQPAIGDWDAVLARVACDLAACAKAGRVEMPPPTSPKPAVLSAIAPSPEQSPESATASAGPSAGPSAASEPYVSRPVPPIAVPPADGEFNRLKDCRHGRMLFNVNDMYVGRSLELYGEFSEGETDLFRQTVRPGDVVFDIGANIGAHTIVLAQLVGPAGRVFAFEPQRIVFQTLCANVALNNLTNVHCLNVALGEQPGSLQVPVLNPRHANNFGGLSLENAGQGEPVPVIRLDSLGVPACRLLKIDVEGMECQVLRGARDLIERFQPALYVENDRPQHAQELIRLIDALGYDMFWHKPPLFNPRNFIKNSTNVFGNIVSINMLCVPRRAANAIGGLQRVQVPGG